MTGPRLLIVAIAVAVLASLHGWPATTGTTRPAEPSVAVADAPPPAPVSEHHHDSRPDPSIGACLLFMTAATGGLALAAAARLRRISRLAAPARTPTPAGPAATASLTPLCVLRT